MNKAIVLAVLAALMSAPLAAASLGTGSETQPDCEEGQPGIGWNPELLAPTAVGPYTLHVCEGEHWDGQDYRSEGNAQTDTNEGITPCTGVDPAGTVAVLNCADPDDMPAGATNPLAVRATAQGDYAFVGLQIFSVGVANVALETGDGQTLVGVYLKDHSPLNVLAQAVSAPRITKGYVSDGDCTYDDYEAGANSGNANMCGRDNTAVTIALLG